MLGRRCRLSIRGMRTARNAADARLRALEKSFPIGQGAITRVDICQLAANSPIEDFYSLAKCVSSNAFLFAVCDGHGGGACSRFVSAHLLSYICAASLEKHKVADVAVDRRLNWIFSSADAHLPGNFGPFEASLLSFYNKIINTKDMTTVRKALQAAFLSLDDDIARAALPDSKGRIDKHKVAVAASGSCVSLAHIRQNHVHVANVGDCAVVLGVASPGGMSALQLSRAHCVDNADEVARIRNSHPTSESHILRHERLLGELYPLRAFGDVRFKWPLELQKAVLGATGTRPPPNLLTPPYLIATPEVFYHQLTSNDHFLIIASDGLWEWLDADTAVRLVHDHSCGALSLQPFHPTPGLTLRHVHSELEERKAGKRKRPLDENSATHLVRHALGGVSGGMQEQYHRLHDILHLPPGNARSYRDDISVIVVHFDPNYLSADEREEES